MTTDGVATDPLAGQVAVITGGGRGIGRAVASAFGRRGMHLALAARTASEIEDTAALVREAGGSACAIACDVTSEESVAHLMAEAAGTFGHIDLVMLNAGISGAPSPIEELALDEWRRCVDVNLTGVFLGIRAAIPHLRANGGGKIIGVGSASSIHSPAQRAPYSATKAALTALLRTASRELRPYGIAVNELQPGPTATLMHGVTERDPDDALAAAHPRGRRENGDWFKAPHVVGDFMCYIASLPHNGPTGQVFSLNSFS